MNNTVAKILYPNTILRLYFSVTDFAGHIRIKIIVTQQIFASSYYGVLIVGGGNVDVVSGHPRLTPRSRLFQHICSRNRVFTQIRVRGQARSTSAIATTCKILFRKRIAPRVDGPCKLL